MKFSLPKLAAFGNLLGGAPAAMLSRQRPATPAPMAFGVGSPSTPGMGSALQDILSRLQGPGVGAAPVNAPQSGLAAFPSAPAVGSGALPVDASVIPPATVQEDRRAGRAAMLRRMMGME